MSLQKTICLPSLLALALVSTSPTTAVAEDSPWRGGVRVNILGGTGVPTNDTLGFGLFGGYRLNDKWRVGFGLDIASGFDVEEPEKFVGLIQQAGADVVDANADAHTVMGWIERDYSNGAGKWSWFWTAGLGVASVSVDDSTGPLEGGGTWEMSIDAGTEFVLSGSAGVRRQLGSTWALELAFRLDRHFADWTANDRVSGATGTVDDYLIRGFTLGIMKSF